MISQRRTALRSLSVLASLLAGCTAPQPQPSPGTAPAPPPSQVPQPSPSPPPEAAAPTASSPTFTERGRVSLYGEEFAGRKTASGEIFDPQALTMAHRTLPFGTRVRVINLANQRSVEVVVNDRGPAVLDRIADLSLAAARRLGMVGSGVIEALLEVVGAAPKPASRH